jgi:molybdopterin-guanine dinucleotide biosynthesis protein A
LPDTEALPPSIAGAVFAGGMSSRMGRPKEGILLPDGRPMIEWVLDAFRGTFQEVFIVGACTGYDWAGNQHLSLIADRRPGQGPLSGLEALLDSGAAEGYVVAACDQPLLTASLLRLLSRDPADRPRLFRSRQGGQSLGPLPGYYPAWLGERVRQAVGEGRLAFRQLLSYEEVDWLSVPTLEEARLASVNTPEDLEMLCASAEGRDWLA